MVSSPPRSHSRPDLTVQFLSTFSNNLHLAHYAPPIPPPPKTTVRCQRPTQLQVAPIVEAESSTASPVPAQTTQVAEQAAPDPFLRPPPKRAPKRRFVPLPLTQQNTCSQQAPPDETAQPLQPLRPPILNYSPAHLDRIRRTLPLSFQQARSAHRMHLLHAAALYPNSFTTAITDLRKLLLHPCHPIVPPTLPPLIPFSSPPDYQIIYVRTLISSLPPYLLYHLSFPKPTSFPLIRSPWTPSAPPHLPHNLHALHLQNITPPPGLAANLERCWDSMLVLHNSHSSILDVPAALDIMNRLHPANTDIFAVRFLDLASKNNGGRMELLSSRLYRGKGLKKGRSEGVVVLHRVPELVRSMFGAHTFFLDFVLSVDSSRLQTALVPRLWPAVVASLQSAANATANDLFTEAVLMGRLYARLLGVVLCKDNWPHSNWAADAGNGWGLGAIVGGKRAHIWEQWVAGVVDLAALIVEAVKTREIVVVVAVVSVADVLIRMAAADPVASRTKWYERAVNAIRNVAVIPENGQQKGGEKMFLLNALVGDLMAFQPISQTLPEIPDETYVLRCDPAKWTGVCDSRFIKEVVPCLEALFLPVAPDSVKSEKKSRRIIPQTCPLPLSNRSSSMRPDNTVQSELRREFYSRLDARLRDLLRVVVKSQPKDDDNARRVYVQAAKLLFPDTPETVVGVAANLCVEEAREVKRELESGVKKDDRAETKMEIGEVRQQGNEMMKTAEAGLMQS